MPSGLVSVSGSAGAARRRCAAAVPGRPCPVTAMPYFGSGSSTLCPPATWQPASAADVQAAAQHLAREVERQHVARPGQQVDRDERRAAHRVHVGQRVGRGDPAPVVRVVDDRGEEVGGGHDGPPRAGADHGRVVAVVEADEQLAGARQRSAAGRPATTASSSPGGILQAQPPPCAYWVRRRDRRWYGPSWPALYEAVRCRPREPGQRLRSAGRYQAGKPRRSTHAPPGARFVASTA